MKGLRFLIFFVGITAMASAVLVGAEGFNYEFELKSTSNDPPTQGQFAPYGDFDANEQQMIRGAINGNRYTFENEHNLPDPSPDRRGEARVGELTVEYRNEFYSFKRGSFFDITTLAGGGAVALGISGLTTTGAAVFLDTRK